MEIFSYYVFLLLIVCVLSAFYLFAVAMFCDYKDMGNIGDLVAALLLAVFTTLIAIMAIGHWFIKYPTPSI